MPKYTKKNETKILVWFCCNCRYIYFYFITYKIKERLGWTNDRNPLIKLVWIGNFEKSLACAFRLQEHKLPDGLSMVTGIPWENWPVVHIFKKSFQKI